MTTLMTIPAELNAGDQWEWTVNNSNYLASAGWVMSYVLINSLGKIEISSSASGDSHNVDHDGSAASAGSYQYQQYFTNAGERKTADRGYVEIKPDFSSATTFDGRSHTKKVLDAIEATIEGVASKSQQAYSIQGRSLSRYSMEELRDLRREYQALWNKEKRREAIANGKNAGGRVLIKMGGG